VVSRRLRAVSAKTISNRLEILETLAIIVLARIKSTVILTIIKAIIAASLDSSNHSSHTLPMELSQVHPLV